MESFKDSFGKEHRLSHFVTSRVKKGSVNDSPGSVFCHSDYSRSVWFIYVINVARARLLQVLSIRVFGSDYRYASEDSEI